MRIKNPLFVVKDMKKSKFFYRHVLGLRTVVDLGAHVVLTGGLALQTEESFVEFTQHAVTYRGNDKEIYFEEDNFSEFLKKLDSIESIEYVCPFSRAAKTKIPKVENNIICTNNFIPIFN